MRAALGIGLSGADAIAIAIVYLLAILVVPMPPEDRVTVRGRSEPSRVATPR